MTVHTQIAPESIADPAANYAHAVLTAGAGRWLHVSGQVGTRRDGVVPDAIDQQAAVVWENIAAILTEARMRPTDLVSIATFVVGGHDLGAVMAARDAFVGEHRVASTLVTVPALARPEWLLEVAAVAAAD